jgi:DNA-binding transcriptional ArsR family regulator
MPVITEAGQSTEAGYKLLPQPSRAELSLPVVMGALADPVRLAVMKRYLTDGEHDEHTCTWVGLNRPKSTQTHHFRVLREAGLLEQRQYGLERRGRVRVADLEARFPGLLNLVRNWEVPVGLLTGAATADLG